MVGHCNRGLCRQHKFTRGQAGNPSKGNVVYKLGGKYCKMCVIFLEWDGLWCPCCGYRLRTRPRTTKLKVKLGLIKYID